MTDSSYVSGSRFLSSLLETILSRPVTKAHSYALEALEQHSIAATAADGSAIVAELTVTETGEKLVLNWSNRKTATHTVAKLGELLGY